MSKYGGHVEISGTRGACNVIAGFWLRKNNIPANVIEIGDKLEVSIRLLKKVSE
jgi:hypothetical protein